jgi:hypothetical protein
MADVLLYLVRLADRCKVDLPAAAKRKLERWGGGGGERDGVGALFLIRLLLIKARRRLLYPISRATCTCTFCMTPPPNKT